MIFRFGFPHIYGMSGAQYPLTARCAHCLHERIVEVWEVDAFQRDKAKVERVGPGWYRIRPEEVCPQTHLT